MKQHIKRRAHFALIGWVAMLGIDLLLHGGILARWYVQEHPFLLPPASAFARIPLGYLGLFVLAGFMAWLYDRLDVWGGGQGYRLGLVLGGTLWGAWILGLLSVSTAPLPLLAGWLVGQALELAVAGAVIGSARSRQSMGPLWMRVAGLVGACVILTILLQSLGVAPSMRMNP